MKNNECGICGHELNSVMFHLAAPVLLSDGDLFEDNVSKSFCDNCQILLTTPSSWKKLEARYAVEYSLAEKEVEGEVQREIEGVSRSRSLLANDWVSSLLTQANFNYENISILEIGSGTGALASTFISNNSKVECVEPNLTARTVCQKRGIACAADLSEVNGEFDLILLFTSLEHINYPLETIKLATSKLRKSGVIAIVVPESTDGSYDYFYGDHLYHFSRFSLSKLMKQAGFAEVAYESGKGWARGVFGAVFSRDGILSDDDHNEIFEKKLIVDRIDHWNKVFSSLESKIVKSLNENHGRLVVFGAGQMFVFLNRFVPSLNDIGVHVDDNITRYPFAVNQSSYLMEKEDVVLLLFTPPLEMLARLRSGTSEVISFWSFYEQCV